MSSTSNHFLASLSRADVALLQGSLKQISYRNGHVFGEAGAPIRQIMFPESGLISIVVDLPNGDRLEAAVIGRDGVLGGSVAFGGRLHINTAIVQMPGTYLTMSPDVLINAAEKSEPLRDALFRQEQYLLAQAQQTAACNARHRVVQRLATWLLRVRDAHEGEDIELTQEFLAQMLGVQRASVSLVAAELQNSGLIRYRRGHITIQNMEGLSQAACECYAAVRLQRRRLFDYGNGKGTNGNS